MIERSSIAIDKDKSKEFIQFMKENAKDKSFWKDVAEGASKQVDKEALDKLFR